MTKTQILQKMVNPGVIAVIRADSSDQLVEVARALQAGGVTAMEITMTTPNAIEVIKAVTETLGSRVLMGVGTVLDTETCRPCLRRFRSQRRRGRLRRRQSAERLSASS